MIDETRFDKSIGDTIPMMFRQSRQKFEDITLVCCRNSHGRFDRYSYTYMYERCSEMAFALKSLGVKRGDLVGIIADNRREWFITDMALLFLGAADVPRGCDSTGVEICFIMQFTQCKLCFFENDRQLNKFLEGETQGKVADVVMYEMPQEVTIQKAKDKGITVHNFWELEAIGHHASGQELDKIENGFKDIKPSDTATIIFTSGTTGEPKGVILTHDNFIVQAQVVHSVLGDHNVGDLWLSILPIWHSFERIFVYLIMALGGGVAYSRPIAGVILSDMEQLEPQWMCAVPRLWESIAHSVYSQMKKIGGLEYILFNIAMAIGKQYSWAKDRVTGLVCHYKKYPRAVDFVQGLLPFALLFLPRLLCDAFVFKKIRAKLGSHMVAGISGGGALPSSTDAFYRAIGFKLLEGYGMTETAPVLSLRNSKKARFGCIGEVVPCVDIKIVAQKDGEILDETPLQPGKPGIIMAKGRQVMKGYYKREDLTCKVISSSGYINTGDLGILSYDNELKILGRVKDTIVLLGGENVEPVHIEKAITSSIYIQNAVVLGQDKRSVAALIVPCCQAILSYADENHIVYETYETLLESTEIKNLIRQQIDLFVCAKTGFRSCERISSFAILKQNFKIGQEINTKQELVRPRIQKLYAKQIKRLFK